MSADGRLAYASTLPEGTGIAFADSDPAVWIVRARPRLGRYGILTTTVSAGEEKGETVIYTVVDWEEGVRGKINIMGAQAIRTMNGPDPAIDKMVGHLNTNRRVTITDATRKTVNLTEIIFRLEDHAELFPSTNQDLVHVGGMRRLTAADRCDHGSCGAQAYVATRMRRSGQTLQWCAHHYAKQAVPLVMVVDEVLDQRHELTARAA